MMLLAVLFTLAVDLDTLRALRELPKPTYWYTSGQSGEEFWLKADPSLRAEIIRICGTRCMAPRGLTPEIAQRMLAARNVPIGLDVQVWFDQPLTVLPGATTRRYLDRLRGELRAARQMLGDAPVARVLVDWEGQRGGDELTLRLAAVRAIIWEIFPEAQQDWYQCGQIDMYHGWGPTNWGAERLAPAMPYCPTLYELDRFDRMYRKLELNIEAARTAGVPLRPIISLGASYQTISGPRGPVNSDYVSCSLPAWSVWLLGGVVYHSGYRPPTWLHNRGIDSVSLYPGPLDPRYPLWLRDFVRLVAGAREAPLPDQYLDRPADLDADGDVDMDDFGIFQRQVTGANR